MDTPWTDDLRARLDELLDEYRMGLHDTLDGLEEVEARVRVVPSKTTLLGLLKHVTYVERFYFGHLLQGRTLAELGVASTPDRSFTLAKTDDIAGVQAAHRAACEDSRRVAAGLGLGDEAGGPRGPRSLWAVHLQVLRELAQHSGHADIVREQVLDRRRRDLGHDQGG